MNHSDFEFIRNLKISTPEDLSYAILICGNRLDLWALTDPPRLGRFATKRARSQAYREFQIPKHSGGFRTICAPVRALKDIQKALNVLLQQLVLPSDCATGFVPGRSIRDNAERHLHQTCVFNTDLENFFPSISRQMVRQALHRAIPADRLSPDVQNLICKLCTVPRPDGEEVLPQGAPTSPTLSNIVLRTLDERLAAYADRHGCIYTRYADDITLSHHHPGAAWHDSQTQQVVRLIERSGFRVNPRKTRVQRRGERQEVTGLTVGTKVNVPRSYIGHLRTLLHLWKHYGYREAQTIFDRDFCGGVHKDLRSVVNGKINYLAMVKGADNSTVLNYRQQLSRLIDRERLTAGFINRTISSGRSPKTIE